MGKRLNVAVVPALIMALAAMILLADHAQAKDDFEKFIERAKQKYEQHRSTIQDEIVVQEMETTTSAGAMTVVNTVYRKADKTRIDTETKASEEAKKAGMPESITTTVVFDGTDYWMMTPLGEARKLSARESEQYKGQEQIWDLISGKAELAGSEKLGERDCYIVALRGGEGSPGVTAWMDKKTSAVVAFETGSVRGQKTRMVNSDFRKLEDGWEIPYKTEIYMGGNHVSTLTVKSHEVNKGIPDVLFDPEKLGSGKLGMTDPKELMQKQD